MNAPEFCQSLTKELRWNKSRCKEIDRTRKALEAERRTLQARSQMLESVGILFESSEEVVKDARTRQARLNPAGLYKSSQQVFDEAHAIRKRPGVENTKRNRAIAR